MANFRIAISNSAPTLVLLVSFSAASTAHVCANPPNAAFAQAYSQGLDALEQGDWPAAVTQFTAAIDADEDSADAHTARGVARVLAEQFDGALKDLQRANKLQPADFDAKLWLSAAYFMNDDAENGSKLFTHGSQKDSDYAETVQVMFRTYSDSKYRGGYYDKLARKRVETTSPVKTEFPKAAAAFVRRHRAGAAVGSMTDANADALLKAGKFGRALAQLELLRAADPGNLRLLQLHAEASLGLGDAITARQEFTQCLTSDIQQAAAYAGRAKAAAAMGDAARATLDRALAEEFGAIGGGKPANADIIRAGPPTAADVAQTLPKELFDAARAGKPDEALLDIAEKLHKAAESHRRRMDETYQDRLRQLTESTRVVPATADSLAALGEFLYKEATHVRGEAVEPRAPYMTYRPTTPESLADELKRAEDALDAALKMQPEHLRALTYKAGCLAWRLKWDEAETIVRKAMALAPSSPELLELFSQLLDHAASVKASKASNLRSVDTWSDLSYTYWRYPSQSELDQADVYDTQAEELWGLANNYLSAAAKTASGTALGDYYTGVIARRNKDYAGARTAFEKAVERKPDMIEARDQLSTIYSGLGMVPAAHQQQAAAANVVHTTAGPMLRLAWLETARTARKGAREASQQAWGLDAADPRCAAYMAVIEQDAEKHDESIAWCRAALALLQTRTRLHGQPTDAPVERAYHDEDLGLLLQLRMLLAAELTAAGKSGDAIRILESVVALQPRIGEEQMRRTAAVGMLPDPTEEPTVVPQAQAFAAKFGDAHIQLGNALLDTGKLNEAEAHFTAVERMEADWPATATGREALYACNSWARLGMVRVLMKKGDAEAAHNLFIREGWPGGLPDKLKKAIAEQKRIFEKRIEESGQDQNTETPPARPIPRPRRHR